MKKAAPGGRKEEREINKLEWKEKQKRIGETAKQVAEILAKNKITYLEVPQVFGKAKNYLVISEAGLDLPQ